MILPDAVRTGSDRVAPGGCSVCSVLSTGENRVSLGYFVVVNVAVTVPVVATETPSPQGPFNRNTVTFS